MLAFAFYLSKVVICSGILFGYYLVMLRNKIIHQYNRFYLLTAIVLSVALPLIHINIWETSGQSAPQAIKLLQAFNGSNEYLEEIVIIAKRNSFTGEDMLLAIYVLTCLVFFALFIRSLLKIRSLFLKNRHRISGDIFFVNTTASGTPFSFLKYIFWNDLIDPETTTGKQVFRHELAHVQQKHSYDKLFINLVLTIFWCNPFFWLIRKELDMIHEFVADRIAFEKNDTESFAAMVLQLAFPRQRFPLTNSFFYSPIKRRLMMLKKNSTATVGYIGRLLVLPLTLIIFAAFTLKTRAVEPVNSLLVKTNKETLPGSQGNAAQHRQRLLSADEKTDTMPGSVSKTLGKALVIIDGRQSNQKALNALDPKNIESIDVITDKEGIKKYGEKGRNGVVVVTKKNEVHVKDVTFYVGADTLMMKDAVITGSNKITINHEKDQQPPKPMYIIDGKVQTQELDINTIDAANIQSVSVLKDKSATDKYGEKAVSGAIEIVTKNGKGLQEKVIRDNTKISGTAINGVVTLGTPQDQPDDKIFTKAEFEPAFPGGDAGWKNYLLNNLKAEMPLQDGWKEGIYDIVITFIVRKDGTIADVKADNYPGSKTAEHCIDLIRNGPKWQPAIQNGHMVSCYKKQPIKFVVTGKY